MGKKLLVVLALLVFVVTLSSCSTTRRSKDLENQSLRNQISVLQAQLQSKDEEISGLKDSLNKPVLQGEDLSGKVAKKKVIPEVKSRPTVKQIQIALKNAGYDPGSTDGKMGKKSREAIRAFQRANDLPVDGKVGKKTWNVLRKYLYQKVK